MTKIADDFAAIRRRCAEMNGDAISPEANAGKGIVSSEYHPHHLLGTPPGLDIVVYGERTTPPLTTEKFVAKDSFGWPQAAVRSITPIHWRVSADTQRTRRV